jgi:hypothetical protein
MVLGAMDWIRMTQDEQQMVVSCDTVMMLQVP